MARFTTTSLGTPPPSAGVHIGRILTAKERTSENGNQVLSMRLRFPGGEELSAALTFTESTRKIIGYFARSAGLVLPTEAGAECEILPGDVLDRYLYVEVAYDDGEPRVARYLSREEALSLNPALAQINCSLSNPARLNL